MSLVGCNVHHKATPLPEKIGALIIYIDNDLQYTLHKIIKDDGSGASPKMLVPAIKRTQASDEKSDWKFRIKNTYCLVGFSVNPKFGVMFPYAYYRYTKDKHNLKAVNEIEAFERKGRLDNQ